MKELGLDVGFAAILDATLLRAVLLPAVMKLLGDVAWWSPGAMHQDHGGIVVPALPERPVASRVMLTADPSDREVSDMPISLHRMELRT